METTGQNQRRHRTVDIGPWAACAVAGLAAGVAGGVLARLAMRAVALLIGQRPGFSVEGTLGIIILFTMAGVIVAVPWTLVRLFSPWSRRTRAIVLAGTLTTLMLLPLYRVATSDLAEATPTSQLLLLLSIFVPIPIVMGLLIELIADRREYRQSQAAGRRLPPGWALGLGALAATSFVSLFASLLGDLRHPALLSSLLGVQSVAFEVVRANARVIGFLAIAGYLALALCAFWRLGDPQARVDLLLLLAAPMLLLSGGGTLPLPLAWLPSAPVPLAATRALGAGVLLLSLITVRGMRRRRALWVVCAAAWAALAIWLLAGGRTLPEWTQGAVWVMLALACAYALIERWRQAVSGAARWTATALTIFVLCWLGLWLAAMLVPGLGLRSLSAFEITLRVPLFWLPWLLLPASLWVAPTPKPVLAPLPASS